MPQQIDLEHYPRKALFLAFKDREVPVFSTTCEIDISALKRFLDARDDGFFVPLSYLISLAVNAVPALRQRIIDGEPWEFEQVDPGYTVLLDDETFSFCDSLHLQPYARYRDHARARIAAVRSQPELGTGCKDQLFFISNLPWFSFTAITHPFSRSYASIPIVSVGRYQEHAGGWRLPVALQVHHALVDGLHVGRFYTRLTQLCAAPQDWLD